MAVNIEQYNQVIQELGNKATLVAVSKTKPVEDIEALYDLGQRDFGENYVQELIEKQSLLPGDIKWHFIGHLQSNKVKYIASYVHLIHGVDSLKLLMEIDKQAKKYNRVIHCLLQVHIAQEETKFGFSEAELDEVMEDIHKAGLLNQFQHITIAGLMGMASFSHDQQLVEKEFRYLKMLFDKYFPPVEGTTLAPALSMGMSGDYRLAIACGSNMVRIGSLLFGARSQSL
jgi:pyridoxal phosphate enzyme (YggS family)